ncbi:hypothetical protein DPX16_2329 [Anabarilius grahami]|uniref:Uncharacterized protein n=1 Tax=Anabarilius grahami TaxID=495550 RepID=A0A3N0Z3K9_ANAGA|nr:hypothetical protein DPX16_2329 [Anabarilius grahami]
MEKREPTADRGVQPAGTNEAEPEERTKGVVAPGCEPQGVSDQVREPATSCIVEGVLVEFEVSDECPVHNLTTVDGMAITTETFLDLFEVFEEVNSPCLVSPLVPSSSELSVSPLVPSSSELSVSPLVPSSPVFPPNLPLPPPQTTYSSSLPPLVPFSLSSAPSLAPPPSQSSGFRIPPRMLVVPAQARSPDPAVSVGLSSIPAPPGSPSSVASPSAVPRVAPLNSPLWRFPSSTPPWGLIMVGLWTNIWLLLLQASPWLLPPSTPPWTICCFLWTGLFFSSALRPPPEPPPSPPQLDSIRREAVPTRRGAICYMYCAL